MGRLQDREAVFCFFAEEKSRPDAEIDEVS
jgi:hypothetical protein